MLSKDVVLAVLYYVYFVKQVLSLVDTVQCSLRAWACKYHLLYGLAWSVFCVNFCVYLSKVRKLTTPLTTLSTIWPANFKSILTVNMNHKIFFFTKPLNVFINSHFYWIEESFSESCSNFTCSRLQTIR